MTATDLKKGTVFRLNNQLYRTLEYSQKFMGRGGSIVTIEMRNLRDGQVSQQTFQGSTTVTGANAQKLTVQYLYRQAGQLYFMDQADYNQYQLAQTTVGSAIDYLAPEQKLVLLLCDNKPIALEMPNNVWLKIVEAQAAVKGNTSSNIVKNAKLETGLTIKVPIFIKVGDTVSVDTTTRTYRERRN